MTEPRNPKAMRNIFIAIVVGALLCLAALLVGIRAGAAQVPCGPYQAVVYALAKAGEKQVFQGVMPGGKSVILGFAHPKKRTWTILLTAEGGLVCIAAIGTDYESNRLASDPT